MKPAELRIGNYIQNRRGIVFKIETLSNFLTTENHSFQYEDVHPIPLTEQWLLKFGFVKTNVPMKSDTNYIDYRKGQFVLFVLPKGIIEVEFCAAHNNIEERGYLCAIKHVHQLQNLYFALTGEELKYNAL